MPTGSVSAKVPVGGAPLVWSTGHQAFRANLSEGSGWGPPSGAGALGIKPAGPGSVSAKVPVTGQLPLSRINLTPNGWHRTLCLPARWAPAPPIRPKLTLAEQRIGGRQWWSSRGWSTDASSQINRRRCWSMYI